jgi:chemotaxis protein methyltransferase CheR
MEHFRSMVGQRLGLYFDDSKVDFLTELLRQQMEVAGYSSGAMYLRHLSSSGAEMRLVVEKLTVCETYFFRYPGHFRVLADIVVPQIRARDQRRQLRVLSAGCASGEEAYSIAITLRKELPDLALWDISILGIDINASMLAKAVQGRYNSWALRDTPADVRGTNFKKEGSEFILDATVKSMARFEERNLIEGDSGFWRNDAFDVVFCRNVTMYLTFDATRSVIARIAQSLTLGGFLLMGHAETLRGVSQDFHLLHSHEAFYYQRRGNVASDDGHISLLTLKGSNELVARPPAAVAHDNTWFDLIKQAAERVTSLTDGERSALGGVQESNVLQAVSPPLQPAATWDRTAAVELLHKERFGDAIELLHALPPGLQADPDAQLLLAALLTNRGELAEAEKVCERLLRLDELNAGAHYLMALCREHMGDIVAAVEHDRAAVYLDSSFAMPHLHLGLMAKRSADKEKARQELALALALLVREDASRVLLFGGGFSREALTEFCQAELRTRGGS